MKGTKGPDTRVLVSAHYDHIKDCDGADDNASGVAGLLETARVLASVKHDRTLVVACWDEEERGLIGARAYADRAAQNKEKIAVAFVYEMIGYKDDKPNTQKLPTGFELLFPKQIKAVEANKHRADFIAIIGDTGAREPSNLLGKYAALVSLPSHVLLVADMMKNSAAIRDLRRSDHAAFWVRDIPGIMITDTSEFRYDAYHCRNGKKDTVDKLDHLFATKVVKMTVGAATEMLSATR